MIPFIETDFGNISTFSVMSALGFLAMIILIIIILRKNKNHVAEENYILPKLVFSGFIGFLSAGLFDSLVKLRLYGRFKLSGITFYGGLLGGIAAMLIVLALTKKKTAYSTEEWLDILTVPFTVFHIFGRIGCFLGGCCYGRITDSPIGVIFPDNAELGIIHGGQSRYPTQLFEVGALIIILITVLLCRRKFECYLLMYSISRFIIEFFRGDERGFISKLLSPSQVVSVIIFTVLIALNGFRFVKLLRQLKRMN